MQTSSRVELSRTPQLSHSAEISDETRNIIGRDAVMKMTSYKHWLNTRNMSKSCDTEKPSALCEKSAFLDEI